MRWIERGRSLVAVNDGPVDHRPRTRPIELVPRRRDVVSKPRCLLRTRRQTAMLRHGSPERAQGRRDRLQHLTKRHPEIVEIGSETLEQHRRRGRVVPEQLGTTAAASELVHEHASGERVLPVDLERHRHFQHASATRLIGGGSHERGGPTSEGGADLQVPSLGQCGDHVRQVLEPLRPATPFAIARCRTSSGMSSGTAMFAFLARRLRRPHPRLTVTPSS